MCCFAVRSDSMWTPPVLPHRCCLGMAYQRQRNPLLYLRKLLVQLLFNLEQHHRVCTFWRGKQIVGIETNTEEGSNASTPTGRSEAVPDWAVADVQEFVPQGFEHVVCRPYPRSLPALSFSLSLSFVFPSTIASSWILATLEAALQAPCLHLRRTSIPFIGLIVPSATSMGWLLQVTSLRRL